MSHASISRAAADPQLQQRVQAAAYSEAVTDPAKGETVFGKALLTGGTYVNFQSMYWQVAVRTEEPYEAALLQGNGSPGFDETVISDTLLTQAVVAAWPADPPSQPTGPQGSI